MNIMGIIQARCGSSRLPNKVFAEIESYPLIWHVYNRMTVSKLITRLIVATTENHKDDLLIDWCKNNNIDYYRGSETDVLDRFYQCAKIYNSDIIVRITADDPFKDPIIIDKVIELLISGNFDFAYNNNPPSFPEGLDAEVFTFTALEMAWKKSEDPFEREHLTQYFYRNPSVFKQANFKNYEDLSYLRWTIDFDEDLIMVREIYKRLFNKRKIFLTNEIIALLRKYSWIKDININIERSEMYKKEKINGKNQ